MKAIVRGLVLVVLLFALLPTVHAASTIVRELPAGLQIPDAAKPGPTFDVDRATEAYLALLSPEQRDLSNAYFEGGYWLQLWEFVYGLGIAAVLLYTGLSRRMRDIGRRDFAAAMDPDADLRVFLGHRRFRAGIARSTSTRVSCASSVRPLHADIRRVVRRRAEGTSGQPRDRAAGDRADLRRRAPRRAIAGGCGQAAARSC